MRFQQPLIFRTEVSMKRGLFVLGGAIVFVLSSVALSQNAGDAKKSPVPAKTAQAKALDLINDIFKEDFAGAKDPEARSKLAAFLLQQGKESRDDVANRYVLYREARDLAARAGDAALALTAIDEMARDFDVSAFDMKASTLATVAENVPTKEAGKALVELLLPMIAEAVEADQYEPAVALGAVAETAARKSKVLALVSAVQKRNEEVRTVQKGFARLQAFVDRLKKDPAD